MAKNEITKKETTAPAYSNKNYDEKKATSRSGGIKVTKEYDVIGGLRKETVEEVWQEITITEKSSSKRK